MTRSGDGANGAAASAGAKGAGAKGAGAASAAAAKSAPDRSLVLDLNETFHARARLGIMTLLLTGAADFSTLKAGLELTDGNLGTHIRVLEDAGFVHVGKGFAGRRPRTTVSITDSGRRAFGAYLEQLESVIRLARA